MARAAAASRALDARAAEGWRERVRAVGQGGGREGGARVTSGPWPTIQSVSTHLD